MNSLRVLDALPRRALGIVPTPLQRLDSLERELGLRQLLIKRDDLNGFGFGGNKVRKLELLVAEAVGKEATCLITLGSAQSNHARVTAVAARHCGLDVHLVLGGRAQTRLTGNLVVDELAGADIQFVDTDDWSVLERYMHNLAARLREEGARPYVIPLGGSTPLGVAAFARAAQELLDQMEGEPTRIVTASSSGGTHAGLELGMRVLNAATIVTGICVGKAGKELAKDVADLATETSRRFELGHRWDSADISVCDDYIGGGYGVPSAAEDAAVRRVLRSDGVALDHVYTGKAMAGLIGEVARGTFARDERIVFWHTGGAPQLFATSDPHRT